MCTNQRGWLFSTLAAVVIINLSIKSESALYLIFVGHRKLSDHSVLRNFYGHLQVTRYHSFYSDSFEKMGDVEVQGHRKRWTGFETTIT